MPHSNSLGDVMDQQDLVSNSFPLMTSSSGNRSKRRTSSKFRLPGVPAHGVNRSSTAPGGRFGSRSESDLGRPPRTAPAERRLATRSSSRPGTQASMMNSTQGSAEFSSALSSLAHGDGKVSSIRDVLNSVLGNESQTVADPESDAGRFNSIALYSKMKLAELFRHNVQDSLGAGKPTAAHTAMCAHILEELASVPSAFQEVLAQIKDVLLASIYSDQLMSGSIQTCERSAAPLRASDSVSFSSSFLRFAAGSAPRGL